jgi:hypothetical protein
MLYKNIDTDLEVLSYLANYSDVVTITHRKDGGLDIDVKSKVFHEDQADYTRIKNFLKKNGFTSFVGTHTRREIKTKLPSNQFTIQHLPSEELVNEISSTVRDKFPNLSDEEFLAMTNQHYNLFKQ